MKLTEQELQHISALLSVYYNHAEVQKMNTYIQHGAITTFDHAMNVVRFSYWMNRRLGLGAEEESMIVGAFLHDFYLYDWHNQSWRNLHHGFSHPTKARNNAIRHFQINEKTQDVIVCHMWPWTIWAVPTCKEAMIVCLADKFCSLWETLFQRKGGTGICG